MLRLRVGAAGANAGDPPPEIRRRAAGSSVTSRLFLLLRFFLRLTDLLRLRDALRLGFAVQLLALLKGLLLLFLQFFGRRLGLLSTRRRNVARRRCVVRRADRGTVVARVTRRGVVAGHHVERRD